MTPQKSVVLRSRYVQKRLAENLFVCPDFAMIKFRDMELEDWKVHASRAWAVAGTFVEEIKYRKRFKGHQESENRDCAPNGRSKRKLFGTIDNLLALIPVSKAIPRDELYEKTSGIIRRDDFKNFITQLLLESRIFIWKIPHPYKRLVGYSQSARELSGTDEAGSEESSVG